MKDTGPIPRDTVLAGRYRLLSEIGRGGMGHVYRAHDERLARDVAVKILAGSSLDADGRARLLEEARAAARINHPHVVAVYDTGETDGRAFIVMELVDGRDLRAATGLTLEAIRDLAIQLCDALAHVHDQGIVHRDIKPGNVLLLDDAESVTAKITDLGVARIGAGSCITQDGALIGTPAYLAPEQALGEEVDGRADLYSLGVLLYELITGRPPFTSDDPLMVISEHLNAPVIPPKNFRPDVPDAMEAILLRLLAKRREERFADAREAAEALEKVVIGPAEEAGLPGESQASTVSLLGKLARGRLVGRRGELQALRDLWSQARKGQGGMALISGEPGVGKTRLANDIMVYAQLSGALILRGGCYEFEATTPYLPFVEALRGWVRGHSADTLRTEIGPLGAELTRLAPEIDNLIGPLPPNPPLPPNEEKLRLFDHVARFLRQRAATSGVLVFLDDLHWADQGTLSLLHYLLRQTKNDRVFFLGAYREIELDRAHPLASSLVQWNREHLVTRFALDRLTAAETGAMLATLFGQKSVAPEFADALFRETEGNPFFIEEVVKSLIEQGQIHHDGREWQRGEVRDLAIPQSVKEAIGRRLNNVGAPCMEMLHSAAALGKTFEFNELAAVLTMTEDAILDALDEAASLQLVRPDRGEAFSFTHDKIREVLYEEQNPIRRRRLHLRIGEGLLRLYASTIDDRVQELAHHFIHAGNLEQGYAYAERAAVQAARLFALDESFRYYEQALECAESLDRDDLKAHIGEGIGEIQLARGFHLKAAEALENALALTEDPARRAMLKAKIGEAYAATGHLSGHRYLEEAMAELDPATQGRYLVTANTMMGRYHHYLGQHGRSIEFLERALAMAEPFDDPEELTRIYGYMAGAHQHKGLLAQGRDWAERTLKLGMDRKYPPAVALGHEFLNECLAMIGHREQALEHGRKNRALGNEMGARDRIAWSLFGEGLAEYNGGRLAEAREGYSQAIEICRNIGENRLALLSSVFLATVEAESGHLEIAESLGREAVRSLGELDQKHLRVCALSAVALLHVLREEWVQAQAIHETYVKILSGSDHMISRSLIEPGRSRTLAALGLHEEAREAAEYYLEMAASSGSHVMESRARLALGEVWMAQDRPDQAREPLDAAVRISEGIDSRVVLGRSLHARALVSAASGRSEEASADLDRGIRLLEEAGARPYLDQALRTRERISG